MKVFYGANGHTFPNARVLLNIGGLPAGPPRRAVMSWMLIHFARAPLPG